MFVDDEHLPGVFVHFYLYELEDSRFWPWYCSVLKEDRLTSHDDWSKPRPPVEVYPKPLLAQDSERYA